MKKNKRKIIVSFTIDPKCLETYQKFADKQNKNMSQLIRDALFSYIVDKGEVSDIIGSEHDG